VRLARLRAAFAGKASPAVLVGIGDDAAVLAPSAEPLVWTVDAAVEDVHFRRDLLSFEDIGYRATMAAASDLAAMGAAPLGLLAAMVLSPDVSDEALDAIAAGQRAAADELNVAIVGGNLARGGELSISTTALGTAPRPILRDGAREGDGLWLAGSVGLAAAGLDMLLRGVGATSEPARAAIAAWRRPRARIAEGLAMRDRARAAIDVSDGLAQDVGHMARASGLLAVLDAEALVEPDLAAASAEIGRAALEFARSGGEDYALVAALPPGETLPGFRQIGRFEAAREASAVALRRADGTIVAIDERGYDHFAS